MSAVVSEVMAPLIARKVFVSEEQAVRSLLRDYILRQVEMLQQQLALFEQKHGMQFEQFAAYVHERSVLLTEGEFSSEQRRGLGQAIMQEEDDWLDWKATQEMLESWLGLRQVPLG